MKKPFSGINHKNKQINLSNFNPIFESKPIEIHLKEDGAVNADGTDSPSFTILLKHEISGVYVYGQISLNMMNDGLKDIGYQITKIKI